MIVVRISHVREAGVCCRGARTWFARTDLSWQTFLDNGYPIDVIRAQGCAIADKVAAVAEARAPAHE
ncbi:hypothetical protein UFOVP786_55 [uncultured Caudovirales phage]|uniref:Uncharacterized protein n=1 Tax=uncultured Caudovirales phage TaxID=2100421 RepID=A0A6J5NRP6_9CAUD|nr:hypothetical protein UFOVP786_55 [uncultured Caudovirales phage]